MKKHIHINININNLVGEVLIIKNEDAEKLLDKITEGLKLIVNDVTTSAKEDLNQY